MPSRRSLLTGSLAGAALSVSGRRIGAAAPLRVVASFSILADLARQVGQDLVRVTALVGADQDIHAFEPRPSDLRAVRSCDVLVTNGLGLEGWADRLAEAAGFKGVGVVASRGVAALHEGEGAAADPHAWQDVANAKLYAGNIRDGLARADPPGAAAYERQAAQYVARLDALDGEIRAMLAPVPPARRRVVTNHDAFAYYARAYGVEMLAPVGTWTGSEPGARDLAALAAQIRDQRITALFLKNITPGAALRALARETGVRIGGSSIPTPSRRPAGRRRPMST